MKKKYIPTLLALVLVTGAAWGAFTPITRAEEGRQDNSFNISNQVEFHSNKIGDNNGASDASEHSNATATAQMKKHASENENDNENEQEHNNASSTENNDHSNNSGNSGIPTTLQGLLDFLQQLKNEVLALLAQISSRGESLTASSIMATNITASGTTITWTTNQLASSKVYVSTSTPVDTTTAPSSADGTLVLNHTISLANLSAHTTYYYVVESVNVNGIVTHSNTYSFITAQPQSVSLSGSSVATSSLTTSSAIVHWTTNIAATSRVYISTTTPVVTTSASFIENPTLILTHDLLIGGLNASTTYYYVAESKDINGNTAQSTQGSFTTL